MAEPWEGNYPDKQPRGRPRKQPVQQSEGDRLASRTTSNTLEWQECTGENCNDAFYGFTRKPPKCYKCDRRRY